MKRKPTNSLILGVAVFVSLLVMLAGNWSDSDEFKANLGVAESDELIAEKNRQSDNQETPPMVPVGLDAESELTEQKEKTPVFSGVSSAALPLYAIADVRTRFNDHWERALNGDAASMLEISHVMQNCATVAGFSQNAYEEELLAYVEEGVITKTQADEVRSLLGPCYAALGKMPSLPAAESSVLSNPFAAWAGTWRDNAARQGNKLAQLEILLLSPSANVAHGEVAALLEEVVRTGDPRAAMLASMFYANYHRPEGEDFNGIEVLKWDYVGCKLHDLCDEKIALQRLSHELTPSEIGIIEDFASNYEARISDNEPFGFSEGWMKEERHLFNRAESSRPESD